MNVQKEHASHYLMICRGSRLMVAHSFMLCERDVSYKNAHTLASEDS